MMYEKIKFQDIITDNLLEDADKNLRLAKVSTRPLDEILDTDNIHGFLQEKIDIVETRLAYALKHSENTGEKLFALGKKCGKGKSFDSYENIARDLNMYLLDGMPCDRGASFVVKDGDLYLITNTNLHDKYDEKVDLDKSRLATCEGDHDHDHHESFDIKESDDISISKEKSTYHDYRFEFLKGYFSASPYEVEMVGGINYRIYKKA